MVVMVVMVVMVMVVMVVMSWLPLPRLSWLSWLSWLLWLSCLLWLSLSICQRGLGARQGGRGRAAHGANRFAQVLCCLFSLATTNTHPGLLSDGQPCSQRRGDLAARGGGVDLWRAADRNARIRACTLVPVPVPVPAHSTPKELSYQRWYMLQTPGEEREPPFSCIMNNHTKQPAVRQVQRPSCTQNMAPPSTGLLYREQTP